MTQEDGLQELVDSLADRLQRSVALDDRAIRLVVASRHFGDEDPARVRSIMDRTVDRSIAERLLAQGIDRFDGPLRLPAMHDLDAKPRICIPIRYTGLLMGYLWLIDDVQLTEAAIATAADTANAAALILYRHDLESQRSRLQQDTMVRDLLSADDSVRARASEEIREEHLLQESKYVTVIVVANPDDATNESGSPPSGSESPMTQVGRHAVSGSPGQVLMTVMRRRLVILAGTRTSAAAKFAADIAHRMVQDLEVVTRNRSVAGVGTVQEGLQNAYQSYEQALFGARAAQFLPGLGSVLPWESLGVYALLARLAPGDISPNAYPVEVLRLAGCRNSEVLMATAEMFLDCAGDAQSAAQALHIHRSTLYQRVARIEEVTGLSLHDGVDRLTLHLGLKLARLTGGYPALRGYRHL